MALCRIKNPEQLKQHKVGELGSLIGLDRVPEARCLREKIGEIVKQHKAKEFNTLLFNHWLGNDADEFFFYIDGHVRIYYGNKANLPKKYVSRQKLCLHASTEYWVNDIQGLPYLVFMGELTEKMKDVIEQKIIPELKTNSLISERIKNKEKVLFTLVFDREIYEPKFFKKLWENDKIAVVTYRKNVKDNWDEKLFENCPVTVLGNNFTLPLYEQNITLDDHVFREIRCLTESGHQTAIITTHPDITCTQVAEKMFSRWSQENFFKYLIADYDFDKMIQYGTQPIDENKEVVNPEYRKLSAQIKQLTGKIQRCEAKFYKLVEQVNAASLDKLPRLTAKQIRETEAIKIMKEEKEKLREQRTGITNKIKLKDMPTATRYDKLKPEGKLFMNVIKMICYRAETSLAEVIAPHFYKEKEERRMLIKQLFTTPADIIPDEEKKTITVKVGSLSTPRYNEAISELCNILNETETIFPGTDLRLIYRNNES